MSSQSVRGQRKMNLQLDLNSVPPVETPLEEGSSAFPQGPMTDVEAIDDDVIESSPRSFAQAAANARRNRRRAINNVDLEDETFTTTNVPNIFAADGSLQLPANCDFIITLEGINNLTNENERISPELKQESPEPPKAPVFNCPICIAPVVEEMSTRCGHIFCKKCIKAAIAAQGKCPTCRRKVTARQLIRVFLPSAS